MHGPRSVQNGIYADCRCPQNDKDLDFPSSKNIRYFIFGDKYHLRAPSIYRSQSHDGRKNIFIFDACQPQPETDSHTPHTSLYIRTYLRWFNVYLQLMELYASNAIETFKIPSNCSYIRLGGFSARRSDTPCSRPTASMSPPRDPE